MSKAFFLRGVWTILGIFMIAFASPGALAGKRTEKKADASKEVKQQNGADFDMTADDFRVFCGFLDALEREDIKKLSKRRRNKKIAKLAKMNVRKLKKAVGRVEQYGATCDEVGKLVEGRSQLRLKKALPGQIDLYILDFSDPSHVVASVRWRGISKKKLVQEASIIASSLADGAPIAKTIVMRAVNPRIKDPTSDAAMWFEARTSPDRAKQMIKRDRIKDFADSRYIRAFDGVKCSKDIAHSTALGYRRGPCEGKEYNPALDPEAKH